MKRWEIEPEADQILPGKATGFQESKVTGISLKNDSRSSRHAPCSLMGHGYQIQAVGHGTNLHAMWDSDLIKNLHEDVDALTKRLTSNRSAPDAADLNVVHAAEESCKIVGTAGFYPERKVGQDYVERYTPVMEQRLTVAGARLAGLLNRVFR